MTTYNKQTLATFFTTGSVPVGGDYANLIDSQVNIVETSVQAMGGALSTTELITPRVSAGNINVTNILTVANLQITATVTAVQLNGSSLRINGDGIITGGLAVVGNFSAGGNIFGNALQITNNISADSINITGELIRAVITYNAAGTAQATATPVSAGVANLIGASDGTATGYILMANKTGLTQQIYNQNTVSANLYPCVGGQINVLASNAAFGMSASTLYTVVHTRASGYAVK